MKHDFGAQVGCLDVQTQVLVHLWPLPVGFINLEVVAFTSDKFNIESSAKAFMRFFVTSLQHLNKLVSDGPPDVEAIGLCLKLVCKLPEVSVLDVKVGGD